MFGLKTFDYGVWSTAQHTPICVQEYLLADCRASRLFRDAIPLLVLFTSLLGSKYSTNRPFDTPSLSRSRSRLFLLLKNNEKEETLAIKFIEEGVVQVGALRSQKRVNGAR